MYYPIHPFFGLSRKKYYIFKTISKKIPEITEVEHKIGKCIGKSIEKNLLLRNHQTHWNGLARSQFPAYDVRFVM
jgi:hypothetical protein